MTITLKATPFLVLLLITHGLFSQTTKAGFSNGVIDARSWSPHNSSFAVNGSCKVFDGLLLTPDECKNASASARVEDFPNLFRATQGSGLGLGYATYTMTILLPSHEKNMAISLPQIYSSYQLWANEKLIAKNGKVGKNSEECIPQWMPQTVLFELPSDTLVLVLQIANFHHAKGGIKEPVYIGEAAAMQFKRTVATASNLTEAAALFMIGSFFLIIFFGNKRKVALYFAMLCLTWSVRSLFSNLYLFISFYPDFDWATMIRIEYIGLYLTMAWAILFLSHIFRNESNMIVKYLLVIVNCMFTVFTLFSAPRSFTQWLNLYLIISAVLLLYGCFIIVRAWANERIGSGLLTISIILGLNIFGYDIFVYEGFSSYDPVIFSIGYITIFLLMGFALAMHLNLIKSKPAPSTRLTYEDLYKDQFNT